MDLRALLFHPDAFFETRSPGRDLVPAFAVYVVVALVTVTAASGAIWFMTQQMTATTEIDNPNRPADMLCDDPPGDLSTPAGCDLPKTKTVVVGDMVWDVYTGEVLGLLFVGLLFLWPMLAVAAYLLTALFGGEGSFVETMAVVAWGMVPSAFQVVLSSVFLAVTVAGADFSHSGPQMLAVQLEALTGGGRRLPSAAISAGGLAWQAYVWTYGFKHARNLPASVAGATAGLLALGVFVLG
ncbi:Yip1 family protein [Halobacteriaceae archaeon GCM10025711]